MLAAIGHYVALSTLSIFSFGIGAVVLNVAYQLLAPRDPTRPPVVFHYVPFIGCAVSYGMDPYKFLFSNRDKYGPIFTYPLLGRNVTVALGPLGNNFVLNGKLAHLNAEEATKHLTTPVFGTEVIYDVPSTVFMEQKRFIKFGLTTENFRRYVGLIKDEVKDYIDATIFSDGTTASKIDAFTVSSQITIFTASATLQGKEVREAMEVSFAELYHNLDGGLAPLNFVFPNLPLPSYWRRDAAQLKMAAFYLSILKRRRESTEPAELDMLTSLQDQHYKTGEPLSDKQIAHLMIALLMAGQHTSAATGSWAILHLGARPDLQESLFAEQGEYHSDGNGGLKPLEHDTLATPLLSAVIKEVLRLHPPLHSLMRKVIADCPVPASFASPSSEPGRINKRDEGRTYVVPKGHFVLAAPGVSMIDKAVWGEDAFEFNKRRWLEGGKGTQGEEDEGEEDYGWGKISKGGKSAAVWVGVDACFADLPFGAGRHRCIGEQFATLQLGTILATLVRQTKWTMETPVPGNDYTTMIVMPLQPRDVTFTRRAKA